MVAPSDFHPRDMKITAFGKVWLLLISIALSIDSFVPSSNKITKHLVQIAHMKQNTKTRKQTLS